MAESDKTQMEKIKIGQIVNAVALKGEVKVYSYSEPHRYTELETVYLGDDVYTIRNVRYQANMVILKLAGVDDRNAAEALKGRDVYIDESQLPALPEDTYYIRDLIGLEVADESGKILGTVNDVIKNSAQDLYEVRRENGKPLLIPGVAEFILDVDLEGGRVTVRLPQGLTEL